MGLESATYISGLNSANPTISDAKTEGDDHIRLIKSTLLTTFPNVTGAVTPTHTELNYVDGVTSAIQTQLDGKIGNSNWSFSSDRWVNGGNTQPSFYAYLGSTQTSGNVIIFSSENHDQGSAYNTGTGVYTCPVAGVYFFTTGITFVNATGGTVSPNMSMRKGGSPIAYSYGASVANTGAVTLSATVVIRAAANDTIDVYSSTTLTANYYINGASGAAFFCGHLLG